MIGKIYIVLVVLQRPYSNEKKSGVAPYSIILKFHSFVKKCGAFRKKLRTA